MIILNDVHFDKDRVAMCNYMYMYTLSNVVLCYRTRSTYVL